LSSSISALCLSFKSSLASIHLSSFSLYFDLFSSSSSLRELMSF
jgi:hypothetical protein